MKPTPGATHQQLLAELSKSPTDDRYLAGGAALHFSPNSIRVSRGRYHPEDFTRLQLTEPFDLQAAKKTWLTALADAEAFVRQRAPEELGCLYYAPSDNRFVVPAADRTPGAQGLVLHFGALGGVIPRVADDVGGAPRNTYE